MIVGLDSAYAPTVLEAQAAHDAGTRLWSGYLATRPQVGLYHAWTHADFDRARLCGGTPIAFASGWDDPVGCKALAAEWNVRLCLDVESGIRGDGGWVQTWLDASGAGLYGVANVHTNRRAPFHVLAWYIADPGATWSSYGRPASPCGWQWWNSHSAFGVTVDQGYYDDWFLGSTTATAVSEVEVDLTADESRWLHELHDAYLKPDGATANGTALQLIQDTHDLLTAVNRDTLGRIEQEILALKAASPTPVVFQPVLDAIHNLTLKAS